MSVEVASPAGGFSVTLDNFEGPFDLLLSLIAKHKLDITEVALSQVTDEFITYIRQQGAQWDLDQASGFLVVAATLLDLKTARLLPQGQVDDEEDLALLEARDLLFARLLQYRAFKQVAAWLEQVWAAEARRAPRPGGLEAPFARLLPEVTFTITAGDLAQLAADALRATTPAAVYLDHIYTPTASVGEQADLLAGRLQRVAVTTFRALVADAGSLGVTVARFLAVLELFRAGLVGFEQLNPLADLVIRWVGPAVDEVTIVDEYEGFPLSDEPTAPEVP